MALTILGNAAQDAARRYLDSSRVQVADALRRISSGLRVNSALDDAAGLAIATRAEARLRGLAAARRNIDGAISFAQTAGGVEDVGVNILQRMRELAVQASGGGLSASDRQALDREFQELLTEKDRQRTSARIFNLYFDGADAGTFVFQIGAENGDTFSLTTNSFGAGAADLTTAANANSAMTLMDTWIAAAATRSTRYGAAASRLDATAQHTEAMIEVTTAARGRITDADLAAETARLAAADVLQRGAVAIAAQANTSSQMALALLGM